MGEMRNELRGEELYLFNALELIRKNLQQELSLLSERKSGLIEIRKDMYDNTVHFSNDFEKLTEISQYLSMIGSETKSYKNTERQIERYKMLLFSPYFGRFDFAEAGALDSEKIYVGMYDVIDKDTLEVMIYDWRAPISSVFYEYELGEAEYKAPMGAIEGKVILKRQYNIKKGRLLDYFDCNVKIDDEMLRDVLGRRTSPRLKNIVETIQKEQNKIIRDMENELLIVQGVAGSGKTSIALHRIGFLLYQGIRNKLSSRNIMIISPNAVFSKYISDVLPELGEENVEQPTFDELTQAILGDSFSYEGRLEFLDTLICSDIDKLSKKQASMSFKNSEGFKLILDRLIKYYEKNMIDFQDIYYDGQIVETKDILKSKFIKEKLDWPLHMRLKRLENIILDKIHPMQKVRLEKLKKIVQKMEGHEFDIISYSRLLSIKESGALLKKIQKFSSTDYYKVYKLLFTRKSLIQSLAAEIKLPENVDALIENTVTNLENNHIAYEDCGPLLYLKLKIEGSQYYRDIKHIVIDEAQDYYYMHYEVLKLVFADCRYTVLGDTAQAIDIQAEASIYDNIKRILNKRKSVSMNMNKSYRSSYEIASYSQKLLSSNTDIEIFDRHEDTPYAQGFGSIVEMEAAMVSDISELKQRSYNTTAILCDTAAHAEQIYSRLKKAIDVRLIKSIDDEIQSGIMIMPIYMSKGLEFDVVLVYDASSSNYYRDIDRRLLYIACTRALHMLRLYYTGEKSKLLPLD